MLTTSQNHPIVYLGCVWNANPIPCTTRYFWPGPIGEYEPWSNKTFVHYVGNRAPFRTHPGSFAVMDLTEPDQQRNSQWCNVWEHVKDFSRWYLTTLLSLLTSEFHFLILSFMIDSDGLFWNEVFLFWFLRVFKNRKMSFWQCTVGQKSI